MKQIKRKSISYSGRFNSAYCGRLDVELRAEARFSFSLVQTGLSFREISPLWVFMITERLLRGRISDSQISYLSLGLMASRETHPKRN